MPGCVPFAFTHTQTNKIVKWQSKKVEEEEVVHACSWLCTQQSLIPLLGETKMGNLYFYKCFQETMEIPESVRQQRGGAEEIFMSLLQLLLLLVVYKGKSISLQDNYFSTLLFLLIEKDKLAIKARITRIEVVGGCVLFRRGCNKKVFHLWFLRRKVQRKCH